MKSIENKSNKIVLVGSTIVLPDTFEPLPVEYENSASLLAMEKHGDIAIHEWPVATNAEAPVADAFTQSPAVKAQDAAEILAELKKMRKKTEIQALAADLEVEYSDEDTIDVLRGKITDALTSEDRENESPENQ